MASHSYREESTQDSEILLAKRNNKCQKVCKSLQNFISKLCPPWGYVSHFLCQLATIGSLIFQTFLEMAWKALPDFSGLYDHQMMTSLDDWTGVWSTFQAQFSTSFLHLCCMVVCLSPGAQTRTLLSAKRCPSSVWPLLQKHPDLSHRMLLPTVLGWLHSYPAIGV